MMVFRLLSILLLLMGVPELTLANTLPRHSQKESMPVILEIHDSSGRYRRSLDDTPPENLHVKITTNSDVTSLYVRRKRRHVTQPKIYSATKNGFIQEETVQTGKSIFYVNNTDKTAITLTWNNMTSQKFYGSFVKDGHSHLIEPATVTGDTPAGEIGPHVVSRVELVVDYFRDAVVIQDSEDSPLKEDSQRISRERRHTRRNQKANRKRHLTRPRRQVIKNKLYVEYGIVADYKNYQRWLSTTNQSLPDSERDYVTKTRMVEFYDHVVNSIDAIFKSADSERYSFNIIMSGIVIFNETNSPPWTHRHSLCPGCDIVDDYEVLRQFSDWSKQFLQNIIPHDHAALFTGFDLYYRDLDSPKTIGLSFLSRMCGNWSVSVVEEKVNALTVHVAAHELGHNFGASHDGSLNAEMCSATNLNLMASKMSRVTDPAKARNPWTFSACSLQSIYDYVDKITRERRNCLLGVPPLQNRHFLPQPGLVYTADEQCQSSYGNQSRVCRNYHHGDWKSMCYGLACLVPEKSECHVIFPHDGTPCGYQKWCIQGLCVDSSKAKKVSDACPLGDDPFLTCVASDCNPRSGRHGDCCQYCQKSKTTTTTMEKQTSAGPSTTKTVTSHISTTLSSTTEYKIKTTVRNVSLKSTIQPDNSSLHPTSQTDNSSILSTSQPHFSQSSTSQTVNSSLLSTTQPDNLDSTTLVSHSSSPTHDEQTTASSNITGSTVHTTDVKTHTTIQPSSQRLVFTSNMEASIGVFLSLVVLL
ncbi:A disintegrin and metalloproteinase with thrombospondin motifs 10-like [Saccostrea echinata]|uniref:A disintegrin and metalloproteinase with thrombospondin motifs 10-like n=1 Tax=Saccostrea echinata TaxID=191078 RepID=UPI002A82F79B|nr:A disintegrin and metalloproteinase with thrombospondin motifs 10-like [Saccostrea echinata]